MDISTLTKHYEYNHDTNINNQNYGYHKSTHDYQLQNTMSEIEKKQVCISLSFSILCILIVFDFRYYKNCLLAELVVPKRA